jgi:hypothetical protein
MDPEMAVNIEKFPAWRRIQGWLRAKTDESFAMFQTILRKTVTALSQSQLLLGDCYEVEVPDWAHFRASALFYSYHLIKTEVSRFVWFIYSWQATGSPEMLFPPRIFTCHHARNVRHAESGCRVCEKSQG